ncbi:MAG: aminopeptidase P family protein, partial [Thermomicrobiales bacterium]|nr:aminopeptidase P family protein [Thermomicrobiales bacterium]
GSTNGPWAAAEAVDFTVEHWQRPWETFVAKRAKELGWRRIGFEDRSTVVSTANALQSADADIAWVPLGHVVDALRARKSTAELDHLARAIALTDLVFAEVARSIAPGDTEREVGWRIERLTRELTDGTVAFRPIVASGPHAAHPHHAVSDRAIQSNETVIIDMGVASNGYCGDLTRTLWFGDASPRMKEVYNVVHRANMAAIAAIGPGVPVKEVDELANGIMSAAGFGDHLLHSLGHGLGLRVHESPSLSAKSDDVLQTGHVVTVEPGIYIADWGGVRIEDVVVVTEQGCQVLTAAEKHGGWDN